MAIGVVFTTAAAIATASPDVVASVPAQADEMEIELALRYAPLVRVRSQDEPCGDGEPYLPVDVDTIMSNDGVALRGPWSTDDLIDVAPSATDIRAGLSGYHLDFPGEALSPGCDYESWHDEITAGTSPTVYARVVMDSARPGQLALQYWFYYIFNDWNNTHEGDWEMIQIVFRAPNAAAALTSDPVSVGYSQHTGAEGADWGSSKLEIVDRTHPVVYPAEGSHANFFGSALHLGRSSETGVGCDDTTEPHIEFRPVVAVIPSGEDAYLDEFPWLGFAGKWGERNEAFFDGPTGPNLKTQWTEPILWSERQWRDSSVQVPLATAIGPNVTDAFCRVVERGSNLLREALRNPGAILIALAVLVGLVLTAAARTRWTPDDPYPVDRERASGQVLVAAGRLYVRHFWLFIGIGLMFVPVMVVATAAQSLLVSLSKLGALAGAEGDQNAWVVALVLLVGEVVALVAYFCVLAAVARSVSTIERGGTPGLRDAYSSVVRAFRSIAAVGVRIVAVVGVLLLFVVTTPLALLFAVRYAFAIPVLMIEGSSVAGALRRSRKLVRGRWWPVALLLALVVGVGALTGPLVGIGLLFVIHTSFVVINLVAGLVYAVTIPFVALVIVYRYYGLAAKQDTQTAGEPARL